MPSGYNRLDTLRYTSRVDTPLALSHALASLINLTDECVLWRLLIARKR
jgi:hypothetical protein